MNFQLPQISEKHTGVIGLVIISVSSALLLGVPAVPIVTGCAGSIGGFIAAGELAKRDVKNGRDERLPK